MARLWTTGFETGIMDEFNGGYQSTYATIQSTAVRTGSYALRLTATSIASGGYIINTFEADEAELYFRFALYMDSGGVQNSHYMVQFYDNASATQLQIYYNSGTQMLDLYSGAGVLLASGTAIIRSGLWYIVQGRVLINNSTGAVTVTLNNTTALAFSGDTQTSAVASVRSVRIRGAGGSGLVVGSTYIDDVAFNNPSGSYQVTYPGLGGVYLLKPTADGATSEWTPSTGTSHYVLVDDVPRNTTDWIQAVTTGDLDLFEVENTPTYVHTINLVEVLYSAAVTESGYNLITDVIRMGTINYANGTETIVGIVPGYDLFKGTAYYRMPTDGTTAWGTADVDALQAGVEIA